MNANSQAFRRSTPIQRNGGTEANMEQPPERTSLKAKARAALQRNEARNDGGTGQDNKPELFRAVPRDICGEYTPYFCPMTASEALEISAELNLLITRYAQQFKLSESATTAILETVKHQAVSSLRDSLKFFQHETGAAVSAKTLKSF